MDIQAIKPLGSRRQKHLIDVETRRWFGLHYIVGQKTLPETIKLTAKTAAKQSWWQLAKGIVWGVLSNHTLSQAIQHHNIANTPIKQVIQSSIFNEAFAKPTQSPFISSITCPDSLNTEAKKILQQAANKRLAYGVCSGLSAVMALRRLQDFVILQFGKPLLTILAFAKP